MSSIRQNRKKRRFLEHGMFKRCKILAAAGSFCLIPAAHASVWQATLNQSNAESVFSDGAAYLSVLIRDGADAQGLHIGGYTTTFGDVVFTLNALAALDSKAGGNYGIQSFAFSTTRSLTDFDNNDGGSFALTDAWSVSNHGGSGGFGKFDLNLDATGSSRIDPFSFAIRDVAGDVATDYFAPSSGNAGQGNYFFAAHVSGFDTGQTGGVASAWFGGSRGAPGAEEYPAEIQAVPAPAALMLMGSGIAGLLTIGRRRNT